MELIAIIFILVAGVGIAAFVLSAMAIAAREREGIGGDQGALDRDRIAASILFYIAEAGGLPNEEALRAVRRTAAIAAPVTTGIDLSSWAQRYASIATNEQRQRMLEWSVQIVAAPGHPVPLRQYSALLDLSFSLGFHTDALARLREEYGFDYVDHAKNARPREADRAGGGAPLFVREKADPQALLQILGLEGTVTRQQIISRYRKVVAQHHPDKFFQGSKEAQDDAATRFIEITRAYETLLRLYRD